MTFKDYVLNAIAEDTATKLKLSVKTSRFLFEFVEAQGVEMYARIAIGHLHGERADNFPVVVDYLQGRAEALETSAKEDYMKGRTAEGVHKHQLALGLKGWINDLPDMFADFIEKESEVTAI